VHSLVGLRPHTEFSAVEPNREKRQRLRRRFLSSTVDPSTGCVVFSRRVRLLVTKEDFMIHREL